MSEPASPTPLARALFGWAFGPKAGVAALGAAALGAAACAAAGIALARDADFTVEAFPGSTAAAAFAAVFAAALTSRGLGKLLRGARTQEGDDGDRA